MDKPEGLTSQDAVNVVRRAAGTRRVGHTGTLDPMATGLLVVMVGEATKLSEYLVHFDKTYEGSLQLGVSSDTYDATGEMVRGAEGRPTLEELRALTAPLTGEFDQVPPPYSAVKVAGRKLYEYARSGETVEAEPRSIRVDEFSILSLDGDVARFRVACSSGTYVRSLVHDLGKAAGCGAVVASLRRTKVGDMSLEESVGLPTVQQSTPESLAQYVLPMVDALTSWPVYHVPPVGVEWLKRGQAIPVHLTEQDSESAAARVGDMVYLCPMGKDAMAVAKTLPSPPSKPPQVLQRYSGMWFQPTKLLMTEVEGQESGAGVGRNAEDVTE
jgi:tRNA pseudouridine55 synthase